MVRITGEIGEPPNRLLDLWRLDGLRGIELAADGSLVIGALSTWTELRRSALVLRHLPVLAEAAATIGAVQIQNRGTIGGNIVNASPAGDSLPVLLAADASIVLGSARGERTVAAADFWTATGTTRAPPDELVLRVVVPLPAGRRVRFRKVGTRRAQAISKVVMALAWRAGGGSLARCAGGPRLRRRDAGPGAGRGGRPGGFVCRTRPPPTGPWPPSPRPSRPSTTCDPPPTIGARSRGRILHRLIRDEGGW